MAQSRFYPKIVTQSDSDDPPSERAPLRDGLAFEVMVDERILGRFGGFRLEALIRADEDGELFRWHE